MNATATYATYTKLRNGSWGIKGSGLKPGREVTVRKRNGELHEVTVGRIVWRGDGVMIASIEEPSTRHQRGYRRPRAEIRNGFCMGCGAEDWDCTC